MLKFIKLKVMKKILVCLLVAVLAIPTFAQSTEKDKSDSKAIAFSSRQGALITKVYYPLGNVKGVDFEVLLMIDELKLEKMACLRLKVYSSATDDDYIGTLDADEIDACVQSLNYIKDKMLPSTPVMYTECEYKSKDGIRMGAFSSTKGWSTFVYTKGYTSRSAKFLKEEDLPVIIEKLVNAKQKIAEVQK